MIWQMLTAMAVMATTLAAFARWVLRGLIREELRGMHEDVEVLRLAVFNHLSHGDSPVEAHLREVLGFEPRG